MTEIQRQPERITRNRTVGEGSARRPRCGGRGAVPYVAQWDTSDQTARTYYREPAYRELTSVPTDLRDRAQAKLHWITRFVREGKPYGQIRVFAAARAQALGVATSEIPKYTTMVTWIHRYERWGLLGLVDGVRADAGRSRLLSADDESLLEIALVSGMRRTPHALHTFLTSMSRREQPVSGDVVTRWYHQYVQANRGLVTLALDGIGAYQDHHRLALAQLVQAPGDRYSVDSTVLDTFIRVPSPSEPGGWDMLRPVFTVIQDIGSRALLTFGLSLVPVSADIVVGLFRRALDPARNHPGLPALGVPAEIVADGGSEHRGRVREMAQRLGIEFVQTPPNEPELHGRVERLIGTITRDLLPNLPGYVQCTVPHDPAAPSERDRKRGWVNRQYERLRLESPPSAFLTVDELRAHLLAWAIRYNQTPHRGLSLRSPALHALMTAPSASAAA